MEDWLRGEDEETREGVTMSMGGEGAMTAAGICRESMEKEGRCDGGAQRLHAQVESSSEDLMEGGERESPGR